MKAGPASLAGSAGQAFDFLTDLRNFKQFIPGDTISDLAIQIDSCSFRVDMLGKVRIHIFRKSTTGENNLFRHCASDT
jgi:hypothetical protein